MSSIKELYMKINDGKTKIDDLLRNALIIAKRLKANEFAEWINLELSGYLNNFDKLPKYRFVPFDLVERQNGFPDRPIILPSIPKPHPIIQSISEVEDYAQQSNKKGSGTFSMPITPEFDAQLRHSFGSGYGRGYMVISGSSFVSIISNVKTILVNWALDLEEQGIIDKVAFEFSDEDQKTALSITNNITQQFNIGENHNPQQINNANLKEFGEILIRVLGEVKNASQEANAELSEDIAKVEKEIAQSQVPDKPLLKKVFFGISSFLARTGEHVTEAIAAKEAIAYMAQHFSHLLI